MTPEERDRAVEDAASEAERLGAAIDQALQTIRVLAPVRARYVRRMAGLGMTYRQIGERLGMSGPRVSQIIGRGWKIADPDRVV